MFGAQRNVLVCAVKVASGRDMARIVWNSAGQETFTKTDGERKMIRKKDIQQINDKIDNITQLTLVKANAHDRLRDALKRVRINVNKAYATFDENTLRYAVKIDYSVPQTVLYIGDDGEAEYNDRFKAMNELGIIPIEDLNLVVAAIEKAKNINK